MNAVPFRTCLGLNTVNECDAVTWDAQTGSWEAPAALNVDILSGGRRMRTRPGFSLALVMDSPHSPFVDGGNWYVASQDTLYNVAGMVPSPLVAGLTPGARLSWCRLGQRLFWANGFEKGCILNGAPRPWGGQPFSSDERENAEYAAPPAGTVLAGFGGRVWIGVNDEILYTVPGFPNHIRVGSCRLPALSSPVRMIQSVDDGFYVSTDDRVIFQAGLDPGTLQQVVVSREPVIPRMFVPVLASDVMSKLSPTRAILWATATGLELGLSGGQIIKLTKNEVALNAKASSGAILLRPRRAVAIYQP